ncbi:MAG: hypothetical protein Q8K86_09535 [Candidatus Nanopelagicaceae bacterium]|nr:hypothetical protein [Candidatus Nanopelagicaceae bacterium]
MNFHFDFHPLGDARELRTLVAFLAAQDLGYPHYDAWIQRTEHELDDGSKQAVLAYDHGKLIGDVVFQPHRTIPDAIEIKNARVAESAQWRSVGSFLLRQVEVEHDARLFIGDVRSNRPDIINFLYICGYRPLLKSHLYDLSDVPDVTMVKRNRRASLANVKRTILASSL